VATDAIDPKQATLGVTHQKGRVLVIDEDLNVTSSDEIQHCPRRPEIFAINVCEEALGLGVAHGLGSLVDTARMVS
jgi:hypothetical protein